MADFTFYTVAMSRGQIARWALHETEADYDQIVFDWGTKPKDFNSINPMGKVPVLVHHLNDKDHVVTETAAICHYLAETHPEADLLPHSHEKAAYFRWLFFAAGPFEQAVIAETIGWEVPNGRQSTTGFGSLSLTADTCHEWLKKNDFITGKRFTMADVYFGSQFVWCLRMGVIEDNSIFRKYVNRVTDRTAYQKAKFIDSELKKGL